MAHYNHYEHFNALVKLHSDPTAYVASCEKKSIVISRTLQNQTLLNRESIVSIFIT
jgi:hypothetical protein